MAFLKRLYIMFVYYAMTMMFSAEGNVVLMGKNISKSFDDMEANFTPKIKGSGESGILYITDPLDACFPLNSKIVGILKPPFALIVRGGCSFDDKVRNAQNAGFKAAIIYDSEENAPLVAMGGTQLGVKIHAVFISKDSGKELMQYTNSSTVDVWILPTFEDSPWSIMAVSFIALLAMSAVLATCFFVHKHHGRQERNIAAAVPPVQEFQRMSRRMVKAMPSLIFTTVLEDKSTSSTCAICLDDYSTGEKIRVLPCFHKFHAICVDSWLTSWRTFCPVCKRDARTSIDIPPASESTPLLSSLASSSSIMNLPSCHSLLATSSSIPIVPTLLSTSRNHSLSTTNHLSNSYTYNNSVRSQIPNYVTPNSLTPQFMGSYNNNDSINNVHGSSNATPNYLVGSPSSRYFATPTLHSYSSRYMNGSPSYHVGSSSRLSYLNRCESNSSVSVMASTHSLPRC